MAAFYFLKYDLPCFAGCRGYLESVCHQVAGRVKRYLITGGVVGHGQDYIPVSLCAFAAWDPHINLPGLVKLYFERPFIQAGDNGRSRITAAEGSYNKGANHQYAEKPRFHTNFPFQTLSKPDFRIFYSKSETA